MKNFYEIIGTNYEAIYSKNTRGKDYTDIEIDNFLKEKYEHIIKLIETKISIANSEDRISELEEQKKEIIFAYEQIKSPIQREIYNKILDHEKFQNILSKDGKVDNIVRRKTAYSILNILPDTLKSKLDK